MAEKEKEKDEKKEKAEKVEVITAVYKVNLHCKECAREIKKPLMRIEGVHSVEVDLEKSEIKAKGTFDVMKIHKRIEKLSKKNVELISPKVKPKEKETTTIEKKVTKEVVPRTITVKVYMHCSKCEQDLKKRLLMHRGIYTVKTDVKAQSLTVEGTIEPDKLVSYLRKKVHKQAEIISEKKKEEKKEEKEEKKEEKKEKEKGETKGEDKKEKEKGETKGEEKKEKEKGETKGEEKKEKEKGETKGEEKKEKEKGIVISESPTTKIVEVKEEIKIVEVKSKDSNAPYFIHYVYAPQLFSDENPNACYIM